MPFFGSDWRSPGDKWIRTDSGWRPRSDIHKALSAQIVNHFRHFTSKSTSNPRSRTSPTGKTSPDHVCEASRKWSSQATKTLAVSGSSPSSSGKSSFSQELEQHLKQHQFLLSMKSVSAGRSSSRENNRYSTVSDAISKMNFQQALQDKNCFPFICKVLILIFDGYYLTCSGSLQTTLLGLTDAAKDIAIETKLRGELVLNVIEKAVATSEKLRRAQYSGHGIRNIDSKIKSLLKMKRQVQEAELQAVGETVDVATEILDLPDECLCYITSFLTAPMDVLNLGLTCTRLQYITEDNRLWRELTQYHYNQLDGGGLHEAPPTHVSWEEKFIQCYKVFGGKLKENLSCAVCFCTLCNRVFWRSYGHPCCMDNSTAEGIQSLTPQTFLQLFT